MTTLHPWTELRIMREARGFRLGGLSAATGISVSHLSNLEAGRRVPTPAVIAKLARALNVPTSMLPVPEEITS